MRPCKSSITLAALLAALLCSKAADAQVAGPPRQPGGLLADVITGVEYDRVNEAKAQSRLQQVRARFRRDVERGNVAAADRDARRIDNLQYRIAVDEWLIRHNSQMDAGCPPYRRAADPMTCQAIALAARPPDYPLPPYLMQPSAPQNVPTMPPR